MISDWEGEEEDKDDKYVWEDNWDDDNIGDDFSILLRSVYQYLALTGLTLAQNLL